MCLEVGDPDLVFDQPLLDRYEETKEFTEFAEQLVTPWMQQQVMELRALGPS